MWPGIRHLGFDRAWPGYSMGKWQQVGQEFGVSEVFVQAGVPLAPPVVATDSECALYRIPAAAAR